MPQDAYTLRYLCGELNSIFTGGRINRIVQPSADELIFTVYSHGKTRRLLIDVNPASPRIGVTEKDRESPLTAPNFCMLLRKHLLASEIKGLSLIGFDALVGIFRRTDKDPVRGTYGAVQQRDTHGTGQGAGRKQGYKFFR